ncbi:MAG: hypothetical protein JWN70_6398, partial [Planctomycetaceae bacterium]|nr:hypothetical protein [Planctomycetaceae bacterium]
MIRRGVKHTKMAYRVPLALPV